MQFQANCWSNNIELRFLLVQLFELVNGFTCLTLYVDRAVLLGFGYLFACRSMKSNGSLLILNSWSTCKTKLIQSLILHTSPVDIVRQESTLNQSNLSSLSSMNFYLSSALRMMYGRMDDRLI